MCKSVICVFPVEDQRLIFKVRMIKHYIFETIQSLIHNEMLITFIGIYLLQIHIKYKMSHKSTISKSAFFLSILSLK